MSELLPSARIPGVSQAPGRVTTAALARLEQLLIVVPERIPARQWSQLPDGARLRTVARRAGKSGAVRSRLNNPAATGIFVARLPGSVARSKDAKAFDILSFARRAVADALVDNPKSLGVRIVGFDAELSDSLARALTLAALAHAHRAPDWRGDPAPASKLASVRLLGLDARIDIKRERAEAEAMNLARWLTTLPANKLDAKSYRAALTTLAKNNGWQMTFHGEAQLKKLGAGAFLAVSQGNATSDAGIVQLRYRPAKSNERPLLALVGKGIIFDTGGNNLKPFRSMLDMHGDMAGSAVAVATLQALTRVDYEYPVDCWLAITENRISATAYKSRDVVTASNGVTIEVIHTDAEGRMVLADALALAGRDKPGLILDFATLTGACVTALTSRYSGVFTNRRELNPVLIETGVASGERAWPFPMDADYDDGIKSDVADVLQCSVDGSGDHILAARFLQRFVPDESSWIHMDLSAENSKSGLGQVPAGTTGFGVRYTLNLLLDQRDALARIVGSLS